MSDADNQATSILLPAAAIAVFSRDPETLEAARNLENDWRFARVKIQAEEGNAQTAANAYKELASPDLVIVQTDTIDETFADQLEALAGSCDEGTAAVVIGPVNDVYLYRKLIDMGVSDYLVKPVSTSVLADVISKTLIERLGVSGSRLIAFMGAKGGVGTSALAQAAAWGVSEILMQKAAMIDVSGGWSTMAVGMGFESTTTLPEAAKAAGNSDEDSLKRMMFKASERLGVLASGSDVMLDESISASQLESLLGMLMTKYPVVIADLSRAPNVLAQTVINRAHQIIVVTTPALTSLRQARSLIQEMKDVRGQSAENIEMIVNKQGLAPPHEVPKGDIEKAMDLQVSCVVPYLPKVFMGSEAEGKKIIDQKEGRDLVVQCVLPIMRKVINLAGEAELPVEDKAEGFLGGLLGKLKTR